jgi:glucose/arabinose dehydrogenase
MSSELSTLLRAIFAVCIGAWCIPPASGANLPNNFSEFAITGPHLISRGTTFEFSPDGKLFVLEQDGTIEVFAGAGATAWTRLQEDFFANTPLNVDGSSERGLLGIAFDPNYLANRYVYVYYTRAGLTPRNRIVRYTANANGDLALVGSATTIMNLEPLSAGNHNGGAMHFGPGGRLFVAVGDNADPSNAQSIGNRLGKILRINPDPAHPIPGNNPSSIDGIAGTPTGQDRAIWCAGLRNPYTFAFKPGTNIMYINDVGEAGWEEINVGAAGANFGWGLTEGPFNQRAFPDFKRPLVYYHHENASLSFPANNGFRGRAISGGAFYVTDNPTFPVNFHGDYFFAEYIDGWIRRYDPVEHSVKRFASNIAGPVDLRVGSDGALYYLARNAQGFGQGRVYRVQRTP